MASRSVVFASVAAARTRPPREFRPSLRLRSVEGFFLFPSLYEFTQHTRATDLVANEISAFESRWRGIDLRRRRAAGRNSLYYLRRPGTVRHFFTASEQEFCTKTASGATPTNAERGLRARRRDR